ncbi:MAG: pantoate--beta-alanine ligase [Cytophagales bacterium]|nr:MAG: pantoate--beta-alanine ligase [Cytophagales bacterium]
MHRFTTIHAIRQHLASLRTANTVLGFVPTMGALHEGHLDLIRQARQACDLVVASIFVNPIQFNNPDDLARYPRTIEQDSEMLERVGTDVLFFPTAAEIYPEAPQLRFDFGDLETVLEGAFRPGHFNGVGVVVAKLFNIVQPDRAYFGQKDLQQVAVIRRLIRDLSFPVELVRCDTVREADGLAMSSRNRNLTPTERTQATAMYQALQLAQSRLSEGQSPAVVKGEILTFFEALPHFRLEYVEVVNADTLQAVSETQAPGQTAICMAAHLGKVRLIDNLVF